MDKKSNLSDKQILTGLKVLAQIIAREEIDKIINNNLKKEDT